MARGGYIGVTSTYTPIEYIQSTGTQYIDTGVTTDSTFRIDFDANIVSGNSNVWMCVWGTRTTASSDYCSLYIQTSSHYLSPNYAGFDPGTGGNTTITFGQRYLLTQDKGQFYVDGVLKTGISTTNTLATGKQNMYLFTNNNFGAPQMRGQNVKLYGCKLYKSNTLVRDFIPVVDEYNVVCLWDKVEEKAYYNAGTGAFTAGNSTGADNIVVTRARQIVNAYVGVPTTFTPVEYIESNGTQYIDTNFKPTPKTRVVLSCQTLSSTAAQDRFFGILSDNNLSFQFYINGDMYYSFSFQNNSGNWISTGKSLVNNSNLNVDFDANLRTLTMSGAQTYSASLSSYTVTNTGTIPMVLFGVNANGTAGYFSKLRLFSCKIYDDNVLVRDYVPAKDGNNVACLWEKVESKPYYNAGGGSFAVGNTTGGETYTKYVARKIIRGYVGVNGVAKLVYPSFRKFILTSAAKYEAALASTNDYLMIAGGSPDNSTPVKTVTAYSKNYVATTAADLTSQAWFLGSASFNNNAIFAGGKTASSGSNRTNQCLAYTNGLSKTTLTTLWTSVYEVCCVSNSTHCMIAGGCSYSSWQYNATSLDTNLTRTSLTNMSAYRAVCQAAPVGNYLVFCGNYNGTTGNDDFYDNTNVKTSSSSNPYGKKAQYTIGIGTNTHAIFFGGSTSTSVSNAFKDCKAYDTNKVLTSFNLPTAIFKAQGFSTGDKAIIGYGKETYIYNDNLVMVEHTDEPADYYTNSYDRISGNFGSHTGVILKNGDYRLNIFEF